MPFIKRMTTMSNIIIIISSSSINPRICMNLMMVLRRLHNIWSRCLTRMMRHLMMSPLQMLINLLMLIMWQHRMMISISPLIVLTNSRHSISSWTTKNTTSLLIVMISYQRSKISWMWRHSRPHLIQMRIDCWTNRASSSFMAIISM